MEMRNLLRDSQVSDLHSRIKVACLASRGIDWEVSPGFNFGLVVTLIKLLNL
jgi:hypothetical protein